MDVQTFYADAQQAIANENYDQLHRLQPPKLTNFNWVNDIFEPLIVEKRPNSDALIWKSESNEQRFTFKSIMEEANKLVNYFRAHGLEKGSIIYTQLPLVPANWVCYLAAIKGGFIVIPAATNLSADDIRYRFSKTWPDAVMADNANASKIDEAISNSDKQVSVRLTVDSAAPNKQWTPFKEARQQHKGSAKAASTRANDPLFYFFTSGTTGMPKVVVHTHQSYPIGHLTTASWIGIRAGDIHYNISQPGWAKFAWSSFFAPWAVGATIFSYHTEEFDAHQQLKAMEDYNITTFCAPPTALRMLIQQPMDHYSLSLRQCVAAGEPLGPDIINAWQDGTGVLIRDGYGQTESTCMIANTPDIDLRFGSMGKPTFMYDAVIADDDGTPVPDTEVGNICLKAPKSTVNGLFKTYAGDAGSEDAVFKNDLYYTGDKAYRDEDGYIWFVGRNDDVIKASDYRIGPFEVESVLADHEAVLEAAVVASPHELRGNAVKAFITLHESYATDEQTATELFSYAEERLTNYKIPRIIEFVDEFPKTVSGKIRRVELRAQEAEHRASGEQKSAEFFHDSY